MLHYTKSAFYTMNSIKLKFITIISFLVLLFFDLFSEVKGPRIKYDQNVFSTSWLRKQKRILANPCLDRTKEYQNSLKQ